MHPYLFDLDLPFLEEPFHLRSFGVLVAIGFLVGAQLFTRLAARHGDDPERDPERYARITLWILFGVFGGARAMYVLVEVLRGSDVGHLYLERPWRTLFFWEGGLVMYGGLAGGVLAGLWCARREGVRPFHALDLGLIAGFVGQGIGRIGCLMVGDDYGRRVPEGLDLPFPLAVRVPRPLPEGSLFGASNAGQTLYATQVWLSIDAFLLAVVAYALFRRRRYAGQSSLQVIVLYAVARFVVEHFRGDRVRGLWFGDALSTSQLVSLAAGLGALVALVALRGRRDAGGEVSHAGGGPP